MKEPMFTKRHYEAIAKALLSAKVATNYIIEESHKEIVKKVFDEIEIVLIQLFEDDNPRFDRNRWLKAIEWDW